MCHERNLTRRGHAADVKEMIAIALSGEVLDCRRHEGLQIRIFLKLRQHTRRRAQLASSWPPPPPKWLYFIPASSNAVGATSPKMVTAIEQQISAECMPGCMASLAAAIPPTGTVPGAEPEGQASGMTEPATTVGTRISSRMWRSTLAMF